MRRGDLAALATAGFGAWLLWSQYSNIATLSWWYDRTEYVESMRGTMLPSPDYELGTLPWKVAQPRVFDVKPDRIVVVTDAEPYAYQAFASVDTHGAKAADIQFEAEIEQGGTTIGLLQAGKWIAVNSSQRRGRFADSNTTQLGHNRSITVVIANNNPAGETRLTMKSLRLYLRK